MDSFQIVNTSFIVLGIIIACISLYLMYDVNVKYSPPRLFRIGFNVVLCINVCQSCLILIHLIYYSTVPGAIVDNYYMTVIGMISNLETLFVILIDIEILRIYSILLPKLTNRGLDIFKYSVIAFYLLFAAVPSLINMATKSKLSWLIGNITIAVFSIFVVVYDNIQHISLVVIIYRFKQVKYNKELTDEMLSKFKWITNLNIALITLDWTAVGFYMCFLTIRTLTYQSVHFDLASVFCICLHSLALVYILKLLKQVTIAKKQKVKVVTQEHLVTDTIKLSDRNTLNT